MLPEIGRGTHFPSQLSQFCQWAENETALPTKMRPKWEAPGGRIG